MRALFQHELRNRDKVRLGSVPPGGGDSFEPPSITGGTLTINVPGAETVAKNFGKDDDTIKMVVPSGRQRTIELEINLDSNLTANPDPCFRT